jgi:hypothetical protein
MATITRTPIIDDDGSGTTGTTLDNAWKQELYNQIDAVIAPFGSGGVETIALSTNGAVNNLPLAAGKSVHIIFCTNTADLTLSGFPSSPAPSEGDRVVIIANGNPVYLPHLSGLSEQPLANILTSGNTPLSGLGYGKAEYIRSNNFWRLLVHEQGKRLPWTPTLTFGGAAVGMTYTARHGQYMVRGADVQGGLRVTLSAKGTSTGQAQIGGFPYASDGQFDDGAWAVYGGGLSGAGMSSGFLQGSTLTLAAWSAGGAGALTDANFTNASDLMMVFRLHAP